jgi:mannose-1-phosphate guanylyltransferase
LNLFFNELLFVKGKTMKRYAVIMAGGSGTRFWPKSRCSYPKQFLSIGSDKTLIEESVERLDGLVQAENILIVINKDHLSLSKKTLPMIPEENFIVEPSARNTAACIALAAFHISRNDPSASMIVLPSDHKILDCAGFISRSDTAFRVAEAGKNLVTFGIIPEYPETGYGYIEYGSQNYIELGEGIMKVKRFCEKPDADKAWKYYSSGTHLWNSGMFVWSVETILGALQSHLPKTWEALNPLITMEQDKIQSFLDEVYPALESISIDYAVMEKAENVYTVKGNFGWSDVGSWRTLEKMMKPDENGNAIEGDVIIADSANNIVIGNKRLIALLHVDDLIVVDADDALLICPKERAQNVKQIVEKLKEKGRNDLL